MVNIFQGIYKVESGEPIGSSSKDIDRIAFTEHSGIKLPGPFFSFQSHRWYCCRAKGGYPPPLRSVRPWFMINIVQGIYKVEPRTVFHPMLYNWGGGFLPNPPPP